MFSANPLEAEGKPGQFRLQPAGRSRQLKARARRVREDFGRPRPKTAALATLPADGKRLAQADLVLINGLGSEGWIECMVKVSGYRGAVAVATQGIPARNVGQHGLDPHAWQDLALARRYVNNISAALSQR